jgi:hypothetical protein
MHSQIKLCHWLDHRRQRREHAAHRLPAEQERLAAVQDNVDLRQPTGGGMLGYPPCGQFRGARVRQLWSACSYT